MAEPATAAGPLAGVRIVDLTTVLFGPYCTQLLGDLGADVVKIEGLEGDSTRHTGPARNAGMAAVFMVNNRNKRSICLDLKSPDGRDAALALMSNADVFVSNVRPRAIARLGLDYAAVRERNPRLVYCNAVGYGQSGPYAAHPAFDDTIQAMSGAASLQAEFAGEPQFVAGAVADKSSGLMLALAIVAALRHAEKTGEGQQVEVPMFETMVSYNLVEHLYGRAFVPPLGEAKYPRVISRFRRPYRTQDGYICVLPYNDAQWLTFFRLVGRPELMAEPRFATMAQRTRNIDALYELLEQFIAQRGSAEWLVLLRENDVPAVPVKSTTELVDEDEHLKAVGFFKEVEHPSEGRLLEMAPPVRMSATPPSVRRHAPKLGEHSVELLLEAGYDVRQIEGFIAAGVLRQAG